MSLIRFFVPCLFLLVGAVPIFAQPTKKEIPIASGRHALLVGCSKYPNLSERFQLQGPANDVMLMKQTLTKYFQFTEKEIVTLSENDGEKNKDSLPTRANIEREFRRLAKVAKEGDYIFILMGGHGSQQPESGRGEPEPDGLDEIFLPRDVGKWEDKAGTVENAIVDKDFGDWLKALQDKKASICIIFDACHSGTMTRGAGTERLRQVNPLDDLRVSEKAIKESVDKAKKREAKNPEKSRGVGGPVEPAIKFAQKGGLVAIAAAQPTEPTLEQDLPLRSPDAKPYGLLTYTICQVLSQAATNASKPLTYRELTQRVQQHYVAMGRTFPTPVIEGGDADREFLGNKVWEGRSAISLRKSEDGFKINAGSLQGLTRDSILAVYPPVGDGEKLIGYVKIKTVHVTDSEVEPVAYEKSKLMENLPLGGVCKVAFVDYGDMKLRIAIDPKDDSQKDIAPQMHKKLMEVCKKRAGTKSLIEVVDDIKQANWIVRLLGKDQVLLVPASGWIPTATASKAPAFGPAKIDQELGDWLENRLSNIARVENLKAIVARCAEESAESGAKIEAELSVGVEKTKWPDPNIIVYDMDKVRLHLKNTGKTTVDVTVLYLNSGYGIDGLFPDKKEGDYNRLASGESKSIGFRARSKKSAGQEHLLIIAVKASGEVVDFIGLSQPSLEQFRDVTPRGERSKPSPLQALLLKGAYADGNTRGLTRETDDAPQTMKLITWQLLTQKRAEPSKTEKK